MSVKSQFLKKLQTRDPVPASFTSKTQADIAEFCLRMTQLQRLMDAWLEGTDTPDIIGNDPETFHIVETLRFV